MHETKMDSLRQLLETMCFLRSENGCSWDRQQTEKTLRPYILEEAYELVDAIDQGDTSEILSELGDLLLQVVFLSQIFSEQELFHIGDVAEGIDTKLKRRHPALFSVDGKNNEAKSWDQIKQEELKAKGKPTTFLERMPKNLTALKLAGKACSHLEKQKTPTKDIAMTEMGGKPEEQAENEDTIGAKMFALVNLARKEGIDAEIALRKYVLKVLNEPTGIRQKHDLKSTLSP